MMAEPEVLVIGRSCMDVILVVDGYPPEDRKTAVLRRIVEGGGQGGTAACCIRRLGGAAVYVGKVGDDETGRFCIERLQRFGVDTAGVQRVPNGKTPAATIVVDRRTGSRTIFYEPSELPPFDGAAAFPTGLPKDTVILLDPEVTYLAGAAGSPPTAGCPVVYDCERHRPGLEAMMERADYFVPSEDFLSTENGFPESAPLAERIRTLAGLVRGRLVVTRGRQGAVLVDEGRLLALRAPSVPVRDTIGAGDNFHAAFALALRRGETAIGATRLAVAVASLSCREYGGREGVPGMEEAKEVAAGIVVEEVETTR